MNVSSPTPVLPSLPVTHGVAPLNERELKMAPEEVSRQFESILVRQMLQETMKGLVESSNSGQVYGYYLTEALAEVFTKGGGFGLQNVLKGQLYAPNPSMASGLGGGPALGMGISVKNAYSKFAPKDAEAE